MDLTFYRNWLAFFLLGTINNLPYVVINSSAKVLATSFGQEQMVTLIMFANVSFGMLARGTVCDQLRLVVMSIPPYHSMYRHQPHTLTHQMSILD
jgi:hypothetical protein